MLKKIKTQSNNRKLTNVYNALTSKLSENEKTPSNYKNTYFSFPKLIFCELAY